MVRGGDEVNYIPLFHFLTFAILTHSIFSQFYLFIVLLTKKQIYLCRRIFILNGYILTFKNYY
jgi:hypothetical protein